MLSVIGVILAIGLALLCLSIIVQYWMVIAATAVGSIIFGPIGGIIGFFLGIFIKGASSKAIQAPSQPRQNHTNQQAYDQSHQQADQSDITIESLIPIISLISYFCLKKDKQWTTEKVRFVKEIFEDACETQADFQLLQHLMKSKDDNVHELIRQFIAMQPDYELRHKVFIHCGIALLYDHYSDTTMDSILSHLGQQLQLNKRDYQEAINQWKNESSQQHSAHGCAGSSAAPDQLAWAYGILDLDQQATELDMKKAFRQKMAQYHPDKNQNVTDVVQQLLNEKTVELQKARDIIMNAL